MTDPGQALELKFVGAKTVALLRKGGSLPRLILSLVPAC